MSFLLSNFIELGNDELRKVNGGAASCGGVVLPVQVLVIRETVLVRLKTNPALATQEIIQVKTLEQEIPQVCQVVLVAVVVVLLVETAHPVAVPAVMAETKAQVIFRVKTMETVTILV